MILTIYSIHDSAANAYLPPFFMHNDGLAIRTFQDMVNSKEENNISKHPDQFTLFKLGEYDDNTGELIPAELKSLGNGVNYKNIVEKDEETAMLMKKLETIESLLEDK
jgi:hypothetical protein